jgi:hypothetical protein
MTLREDAIEARFPLNSGIDLRPAAVHPHGIDRWAEWRRTVTAPLQA